MMSSQQFQYLVALVRCGQLPVGLFEMADPEFDGLLKKGYVGITHNGSGRIAFITDAGEAAWEVASTQTLVRR